MWLLRFIFDLLFNRNPVSSSMVPDDRPDEGGMHFLRLPAPEHLHLPDHFVYYEFASNWDESNPVVAELGLNILRALCRGKPVLTDIHSREKTKQHRKRSVQTFPEYYYKQLQTEKFALSSCFAEEARLAYLTQGFDENLLLAETAYYKTPEPLRTIQFFSDVYILSEDSPSLDAESALKNVATAEYDIHLSYDKYCFPTLSLSINSRTVDIDAVCATVAQICSETNVSLINPPIN